MNQESYQYMKDKTDQYNRLSESRKSLITGRDVVTNNAVHVGTICITNYMDKDQKTRFREQVKSLIAMEIQEIERKMEEL